MRYTPYYLRLSAEKYSAWLATVTDGTECLFQEFAPKGDLCLDHQIEGWTFTGGHFNRGRVFEAHGGGSDRILHNGGAIYYGEEKQPWGEVFQARIVPISHEFKSSDRRFIYANAPIYEPEWSRNERCSVLVPFGPRHLSRCPNLDKFRHYGLRVTEGTLKIVFGDAEGIKQAAELDGVKFLYSEYLE